MDQGQGKASYGKQLKIVVIILKTFPSASGSWQEIKKSPARHLCVGKAREVSSAPGPAVTVRLWPKSYRTGKRKANPRACQVGVLMGNCSSLTWGAQKIRLNTR